ncbi:MAG TPA: methyltransferase domain-containing protein [Cyclobacteriaceae bacterium]|nr:methyltransferase domain-containing protein [Cyclobacteriaceae bacterium]
MYKISLSSLILLGVIFSASPRALAQHFKADHSLPAYFLKKNEKVIRALVRLAEFHPGNKIADVGAGDGLFDAAISIFTDSLTIYMEDIDSNVFVPIKFNRAVQFYSSVKKSNITNILIPYLGMEKSTGLPSGYFDKVLVIDTYHHFSNRDEMMDDINRILKPGGKLYIYDVLAKKAGDIHPACRTAIYLKGEIISHIETRGFQFNIMEKLRKVSRRKARIFVFTKKSGD